MSSRSPMVPAGRPSGPWRTSSRKMARRVSWASAARASMAVFDFIIPKIWKYDTRVKNRVRVRGDGCPCRGDRQVARAAGTPVGAGRHRAVERRVTCRSPLRRVSADASELSSPPRQPGQGAEAVGEDLYAEAEQDEGGEAQEDVGAGFAEQPQHPLGEAVADIDRGRH